MKELIGHTCRCIFNLPYDEWPFQGSPAWVVVEAIDMPMLKMSSMHGSRSKWVNAAIIKEIEFDAFLNKKTG